MKRYNLIATAIILVGSLFYFYEFFIRIAPSVMTRELMRDFQIDAAHMGAISACFYYAYTPMQIPAGLLVDRFGPKALLTAAATTCTLALFLFAHATHPWQAATSRFMIGLACSFAYIAPLVLTSRWAPRKHFAMITGAIQTLGCFGAMFAGAPIAYAIAKIGWRPTLSASAYIGLVLAVLCWFVIRDCPSHIRSSTEVITKIDRHCEWRRLRTVCHNPQTWWTALIGFCCWAPMAIFAELWGVPFLMRLHDTTPIMAAQYTLWIWIGVALGSPLIGWLSNHFHSRRWPLALSFITAIIASLTVIHYHGHQQWLTISMLLLMGLSAGSQCVTFGLVHDNNPDDAHGTAVGFNNMAVIASGMLLQPLIGYILRAYQTGMMPDQTPLYSIAGYTNAFAIIPIVSCIGLLTCLFKIRETHCASQPIHHSIEH